MRYRKLASKLSAIQGRHGTQDASVPSAATMVVARSATGIGGPLATIWGGRSTQEVARNVPATKRDTGGEPHLRRSEEKVAERFRCSARKVARGGLNAEGGIVGGENANWVFE